MKSLSKIALFSRNTCSYKLCYRILKNHDLIFLLFIHS